MNTMPVEDWKRRLAEYEAARQAFQAASDALVARIGAGNAPTSAQLVAEERSRAVLLARRRALLDTGYDLWF
jgi:hypothetical protein